VGTTEIKLFDYGLKGISGVRKLCNNGTTMGIICFTYQNATKDQLFTETIKMKQFEYISIQPPYEG
jgi:hypothetical protein